VSTSADDTGATVRIIDHGLGMTSAEFEQANARIRETSATEVIGAQRLGHHVVGRLAQRLGATVTLSPGPDGLGTSATVHFPRSLFVGGQQEHEGVDPLPQRASAAAAAPAEPEPPLAVPVDLADLTDGQTAQGLPRRRTRAVDPAAPAPSADLPTAPLLPPPPVLPPAAAPAAGPAGGGPLSFELDDTDTWTPPAVQAPEASASPPLPTRSALPMRSPVPPAVEPQTAEAAAPSAPVDPEDRKSTRLNSSHVKI